MIQVLVAIQVVQLHVMAPPATAANLWVVQKEPTLALPAVQLSSALMIGIKLAVSHMILALIVAQVEGQLMACALALMV
jgi:hypothetical protein